MRLIIAEKNKPIEIGRYNENEHILVRLPLDDVMEDGATYEVMHQRYGDTIPYPCTGVTVQGNYLYWLITELDVSVQGKGRLEIFSYFGTEGRGKSYIYTTRVLESLGDAGEIPEPYQPYLEQIMEKAQYAKKIAKMTVEAESIPATEQAEVIKTELEDRINLKFRLPKGEPAPPYDDSELREMIDKKTSIIMLYSKLSDGVWSITDADGNTLTYADIKALHNKEDYIVLLHQNVIHSTSFLTDAIEFMGTYYIDGNGHISRLIINNANVVKADGYALENAENRLDDIEGYEVGDMPNSYPSTDALIPQLNKKAEVFVAEYGVTTYAEIKEAYESGKQVVCKKSSTDDVREYPLTRVHTAYIYFDGGFYTTEEAYFVSNTNAWGTLNRNIVQELNDTNKSHTGSYPSNKAITDYIADGNNLPKAVQNGGYGAVKLIAGNGIAINDLNGALRLESSGTWAMTNRTASGVINPFNADEMIRLALCDGKGAPYTEAEKKSARERIGLSDNDVKDLMDSIYPILDEVAL